MRAFVVAGLLLALLLWLWLIEVRPRYAACLADGYTSDQCLRQMFTGMP